MLRKLFFGVSVFSLILVYSPELYAQRVLDSVSRTQHWNMFRGTPDRKGFNARELTIKPPLKRKWLALQGEPNLPDTNLVIESSPLIYKSIVFVATIFDTVKPSSYNSSVIALNAVDGKVLWSTQLGMAGIWSTPVIDGEKLFVGAWDGYFYALNIKDGSIAWQTYLTGQSRTYRSSPIVVDNHLFVGTYEDPISYLHVLDPNSGAIQSSVALPGKLYSSPVMVAANRLAIVVSQNDGNSLLQVYEIRSSGSPALIWELSMSGDSNSTPLFVNGKIVHRTGNWKTNPAQPQSYLYVVNALTGQNVISPFLLDGSGYWSSPATDGQRIYVTIDKNRMAGINFAKLLAADPNPIDWVFTPPDAGALASSPAVANNFLYFGTDDTGNPEGVFYALNATTGAKVWEYKAVGGVGSAQASPAVSGGLVVFVSYDDNDGIENGVHAFQNSKIDSKI